MTPFSLRLSRLKRVFVVPVVNALPLRLRHGIFRFQRIVRMMTSPPRPVKVRWRRKKAQKLLLFPILIPIALTCGDEGRRIGSATWKRMESRNDRVTTANPDQSRRTHTASKLRLSDKWLLLLLHPLQLSAGSENRETVRNNSHNWRSRSAGLNTF